MAEAHPGAVRSAATRQSLGHLAVHLITPLLMCLGMGLAYLGGFHAPQPHHVKVALVGQGAPVAAAAQQLKDKAGDALDVTTVPDRAAAEYRVTHRELVAAFVPAAAGGHTTELITAQAASDSGMLVAKDLFGDLSLERGLPMKVDNLAPTSAGDPAGQSLFFLLVMVSIGSYASVAVLGAAAGSLRMAWRAAAGGVVALLVSGLGVLAAGPLFHLVDHGLAGVWALSLLYSAGIIAIGLGLHTFLKRWTTLAVMVLFVMLNFTTSGGVYPPYLQNGFFSALHEFWNGAGFLEGARNHVYFGATVGITRNVVTLLVWLAAGLALITAAALTERRRRRAAAAPLPTPRTPSPAEEESEEELEENVAA